MWYSETQREAIGKFLKKKWGSNGVALKINEQNSKYSSQIRFLYLSLYLRKDIQARQYNVVDISSIFSVLSLNLRTVTLYWHLCPIWHLVHVETVCNFLHQVPYLTLGPCWNSLLLFTFIYNAQIIWGLHMQIGVMIVWAGEFLQNIQMTSQFLPDNDFSPLLTSTTKQHRHKKEWNREISGTK